MEDLNAPAYSFQRRNRLRPVWPIVLVLVGGLVLLRGFAIFWLGLHLIGPVMLILLGLALILPWSSPRP